MALSIEIEVPQAVILTKERKNKKEEKMIRLEPRLGSMLHAGKGVLNCFIKNIVFKLSPLN